MGGNKLMNPNKYALAQRINEIENALNVTNENIAKLEAVISNAKVMQQRTAAMLVEQRRIIAEMPD
jgi:hypothetical protein